MYNEEILNNYINGEDIEEYTLEELENDSNFMIMVIDKTKDKNFYNLCSDEVKKDYQFIKYLILKFSNDYDFISDITGYLIQNTDDESKITEIIILICECTKNLSDERYNKYKLYRNIIYVNKKIQIEQTKIELKQEENVLDELGMGFFFIQDFYQGSNITLKYFAKRFIEDLLEENNLNLEESIHNEFDSFESLEEYGIKRYLIDLIFEYDKYLSDYVSVHTKILEPFVMKINKYKTNWNKYIIKQEKEQYQIMMEEVEKYIEENNLILTLTELNIIYYLGVSLGIEEKLKKYINLSEEEYQIISSDTELLIQGTQFSINDIGHITNIQKIMIDSLKLKLDKKTLQKQKQRILRLICKK